MPNRTSLWLSVFGSMAVSTVVPGDAWGWSSQSGGWAALSCWADPVVGGAAAGCCGGGGGDGLFLQAVGATAALRSAIAMARRHEAVVTMLSGGSRAGPTITAQHCSSVETGG